MGILQPLALLALPLMGFIVALYLLRFRRPSAPVGSLHLWDNLTRDREANSLWQRLQLTGLLLLQLLVMLALILALARPWVPSGSAAGRNSIIIIDTSASMGAMDGDRTVRKSRLEAALEKARSIVDDLPQGATAAIITSDEHAAVRVPPTEDKSRLRDGLSGLAPQPTGTNMTEAMQLASVLAQKQSNAVIWVLSDGVFPATGGNGERVEAQVRFFPVGNAAANQAITAISVDQRGGSLGLFVQITNADSLTVTRRLDVLVDDAPWNARTVSLGPLETQELIVDDLPIDGRVVAAHLAGLDELEIDDTAWTVNRGSVPANVLMVTDGNKFLELALALLPNVTLYKVAPAEYDPVATLDGVPFDLTVLDAGVVSTTLSGLPAGNLLIFEPRASTSIFTIR
ncbi:MAG TPA: VWA domain-containing protein, partial [Chloroflexia bacterium]